MPRRSIFSVAEREKLLQVPDGEEDLVRFYTFDEFDLSLIRQRRGSANRIGFAVHLCYLLYPGIILGVNERPHQSLLEYIGEQLEIAPNRWDEYGQRKQTRREHLAELQSWMNLTLFSTEDHRRSVQQLSRLAEQTDRGIVLAEALIDLLRVQRIIIPVVDVIERVCSQALHDGMQQVYKKLTASLSNHHRQALDQLLEYRKGTKGSSLIWLRQPPGPPKPKHILVHLERLKTLKELNLPGELEFSVHQNRLSKIAREGCQMTAQHLRDLEKTRRHATLVAVIFDTRATLIDELIDLHGRFMGSIFNKAKRDHAEQFQKSSKAINEKVRLFMRIGRVLLDAKQSGNDPFAAIEAIMPWEVFTESVDEAEKLAQPKHYDHYTLLTNNFNQLRRYTPTLLSLLQIKAAPAVQNLFSAIQILKQMNSHQARKVPNNAPTCFVRKRWEQLVHSADGIDRRYYELCVLSEMNNSLRAGDLWIQGSRQFKDFEEYLLPPSQFAIQLDKNKLGLAIDNNCEQYLNNRLGLLEKQLATVETLASAKELPDAEITSKGRLKISPLDRQITEGSEMLAKQIYSMLPHLKITELLLEVDNWTGFTSHFSHLKNGKTTDDRQLLLATILADAINLGLSKMAESCPGTTYAKLTWLQAWHIREETYSAALTELVNAQSQQPLAAYWGDGTTSSSDGQNFKMGGKGKFAGQVNLKYGHTPGMQFYTHISDQYAPFHSKVINATVRDATHVLDGLLYHESDLRIEEHYTDTAGFTDHVFALMHLLGFRFAPRIRDLADKRLYISGEARKYPTLHNLIGGNIKINHIRSHWEEILRLASSIKQGTVTASLMLRKLGSYPRQNGLAVALREFGRIERTLFALDWMQNKELRRRVQIGLNKGEARNALARAVFFNRLGEIRDRRFENQRFRASGLNLVVAAIILWNTIYLDRAIAALRDTGHDIDEKILPHLSPLGWEHINLTGDYIWQQDKLVDRGEFRPLRLNN